MYYYIIKKLYVKNPQLLLDNQEILKITRNSSDFRAPQELINGNYIESNIDSNAKFNNLKKLLSLYELEEELIIKYNNDNTDGAKPSRFLIRKKYWQQLLPLIENTELYDNVSPSKDGWLGAGAGIGGFNYYLGITKKYVRIELSIGTSSKEKNKYFFKRIFKEKESIEERFGNPLEWEELPENKMSRIKYQLNGVNLYNDEDWAKMNAFLITYLPKFEKALSPSIKKIK